MLCAMIPKASLESIFETLVNLRQHRQETNDGLQSKTLSPYWIALVTAQGNT